MAIKIKVLVKCLNVSTDGFPVDVDGEECAISGKRPLYTWEESYRGQKWLTANPKLWKPIKKASK